LNLTCDILVSKFAFQIPAFTATRRALQNLCGGDAKLAQALHNRLRDEIARCSARK
jgi:hypothetical protein